MTSQINRLNNCLSHKLQFIMSCIQKLGPRPLNTFKMHQILKKNYKYKYQHLFSVQYGHLKAFFHKFYSQFEPKMKLPFLGMNPNFKTNKIIFDSCFQSGNLDSVVKISENQYDLILRIDSNTAGHIQWYYFKVFNNGQQYRKIKINIVNLRRSKSCYQRGMKPFLRKRKINKENNIQSYQKWSQWQQGGDNVEVDEDKIRFAKQNIIFNNGMIGLQEPSRFFRYLSFELEFQSFEEFEFAYCVPYTYSDLTNDLKSIKQLLVDQNSKHIHLQIDTNNESLSGLEIPVIKITEKLSQKYNPQTQKDKLCAFIIGRQHPGQSNGSFVMKGILNQLVKNTPQLNYLRRNIVFKIIPMLNVDGVVMGNFRTSLYGKDLNRLFKKQQLFLIPEVQLCKEQFNNLIKIHKNNIFLFLDIHGHSARRNSFCYGPGILDANAFSDVRQFAKIIASRTQIFRYPSCSFRIDHQKKTTARACFSKSVGLAYTIESSNWSFYSKSQAKMINFSDKLWQKVGNKIIQSAYYYAQDKIRKKNSKKKKKNNKSQRQRNQQRIFQRKLYNNSQSIKNNDVNIEILDKSNYNALKKIQKSTSYSRQTSPIKKGIQNTTKQQNPKQSYSKKTEQNSQNQEDQTNDATIRKSQTNFGEYQRATKYQIKQIEEEENQSDKLSEDQMDSDSQGEDMNKQKFEKYMNGAKKMMIQFEKVYYGQDYEKKGRTAVKLKNDTKRMFKQTSTKNIKKNSEILACLRKPNQLQKINATNLTQKLQINSNKMIDIAGKITLQPRKAIINNTYANNGKINFNLFQKQFQGQIEPQQKLWISQKISHYKHILPKIEQTQISKKQLRNEFADNQSLKQRQMISRIEKWSQANQTPQLLFNDQDYNQQAHLQSYYRQNNQNTQFIYPYDKVSSNLLKQLSRKKKFNIPFQTVQSKNFDTECFDDQSSNNGDYELSQQNSQNSLDLQQKKQINQNKQEKIINKRWSQIKKEIPQNQTEVNKIKLTNESYRYNLSTKNEFQAMQINERNSKSPIKQNRFSMKNSSRKSSQVSKIMNGKRQSDQINKMNLIKKLNDPISFGYGGNQRQFLSSQELNTNSSKSKNNEIDFQFHNINYTKIQSIRQKQLNLNNLQNNISSKYDHEKIQQIIQHNIYIKPQNSLKQSQDNQIALNAFSLKNMANEDRQKLLKKVNEEIISQNTKKNDSILQIQKNVKVNIKDISNANKMQKIELVSSSVMLSKSSNKQVQKLKTLESQNLIKNGMNHSEVKKKSLTTNRNYSQRKGDKQFQMLRQQEKINRKMLKFGAQSLPKIVGVQKYNNKKKMSENSNDKEGGLKNKEQTFSSPIKKDKKSSIQKQSIATSKSPQTDYKNINLICISQERRINKQKVQNQNKSNDRDERPSLRQINKRNNKEKLLIRLRELERQQRQKFGQKNLFINKEKQSIKEAENKRDEYQADKQSKEKQQTSSNSTNFVKTNFYSSNVNQDVSKINSNPYNETIKNNLGQVINSSKQYEIDKKNVVKLQQKQKQKESVFGLPSNYLKQKQIVINMSKER